MRVRELQTLGRQLHADRVNSACRPAASATPTPMPAADAAGRTQRLGSTPTRTWRRVAPTIRSSPNSFVRCATVIESELKIVNAPTSTATPANASRIVRRMLTSVSSESKREAVVLGRAAHLRARPAAPSDSARAPATRMRS